MAAFLTVAPAYRVDLMTLTAQGKVTLHTTTYPLDAINDAMADLDGGRLQGRGILIPAAVSDPSAGNDVLRTA